MNLLSFTGCCAAGKLQTYIVREWNEWNMPQKDMTQAPSLVVAGENGDIFDVPELVMAGRTGYNFVVPDESELIPLPEGSELYHLPARTAVGFDRMTGEMNIVKTYDGEIVHPLAAFIAPAYTLFYLSGFFRTPDADNLPLLMYGAVGWRDDQFVVAAQRIDDDIRQDAVQFDEHEMSRRAEALLQAYPENRLATHLVENCYKRYWCPAARNFVMGRWEMPLPTSRSCNSRCLGCISLHQKGKPHPPQDRISFVPTVEEICALAVPHLQRAERAIVSFGQGCEGEPLMNPTLLEESIMRMRERTQRGTINLNTNGSKPDVIKDLFRAGLDSIRVSVNSVIPDLYNTYFRPADYSFDDIVASLECARDMGRFSSINYFVFPGVIDREEEFEALCRLIETTKLNMIQWRNFNIDPDEYLVLLGERLYEGKAACLGVRKMIEKLSARFPSLRHGYYNPPINQ